MTPTVDALRRKRRAESDRREMLRIARAAVDEAGLDIHVRIDAGAGGRHIVSVPPETGVDKERFRRLIEGGISPDREADYVEAALALADLADIARRRNATVSLAGGDVSSPPAWAFLGHPVIRGVIAALVDDPASYRPLDRTEWQPGVKLYPQRHDLRLGHVGVRLKHGGVDFSIDCSGETASIRIAGVYPDSLIAGLPGMPLWKIVQLPGIAEGTAAGDAPIREATQRSGGMVITVRCALQPLADPPDGIKAEWLWDWHGRHGR